MGQKKKTPKQFGHQPPQFDFFLNPYSDARFTRCPKCDGKTKLRKIPLFILLEPTQPLSLNKTCRYCPVCDLLIAHKDELDTLIQRMCLLNAPDLLGNNYWVMGTIDRKSWREGTKGVTSFDDVFAPVHDFKRHLEFEPTRYVWMKED